MANIYGELTRAQLENSSAPAATSTPGRMWYNSATKRPNWENSSSKIGAVNFDIVYAKEYGVVADGTTDDSTALNAALAAASIVVLPAGSIKVSSEIVMADNNWLIGQGRGLTILKAGTNSQNVIHFTGSNGGVRHLKIDGNSKSSVSALRVTPLSESQTSTVVFQNFNVFDDIWILSCAEGIVLACGPDVAATDSGCWYNTFQNIHIQSCTRGIWLKDGTNAGSSGCNRNRFFAIRIGQTSSNTGIQIDSADTCEFFGCAFEGITSGSSPNATPTAVKISQAGAYSGDNNSNRFFGCDQESCTRGLNNANAYTELYGCNLATGALYTATPLIMVGGSDGANMPQVLPGYTYQAGSQLAGLPNGVSLLGAGTNNNASAGYVGEYIESLVDSATAYPFSSAARNDLTSISLTAGDWDVTAFLAIIFNGATVTSEEMMISTHAGNSTTGQVYGVNSDLIYAAAAIPLTSTTLKVPPYRLSLSSPTTVYLKSLMVFSAATPNYLCRLSARRVR